MMQEFKNYTETVERFINSFRGTWYETSPSCVRMIADALRASRLNTANDDVETCTELVIGVWYSC